MANKFKIKIDVDEVAMNMLKLRLKFEGALIIFCNNGAQKMEAYAKQHRPWKDRTGNARQRLKGSWKKVGNGYQIQIAHGVKYGVYLEFKNERKYAILTPTVEKVGYGEILPAFQNFMNAINLE